MIQVVRDDPRNQPERALPAGSRLVLLPMETHESLSVRLDPVALEVTDWLEALRQPRVVTATVESAAAIPH